MDNENLWTLLRDFFKLIGKNPLVAFVLLFIIMQMYIIYFMLNNQLDALYNINETLVKIHEDNITIKTYIMDENNSSKEYVTTMQDVLYKVDIIYELNRKNDN